MDRNFIMKGMYDEILVCERAQCVEDREQIKRLKSIALELIKLAHRAHSIQQEEIETNIGNLVKDTFFSMKNK